MSDQHISDLIVEALVLDLQDTFREAEGNEDVGIIKAGRLQDDPTKKRIAILVHIGDPEDTIGWPDSSEAYSVHPLRAMETPPFEVGGGSIWWRRGTVELEYFGLKTKEDRDEARRIGNLTRGRIEKTISLSTRVPGLTDALGETVMLILPVSSRIIEGGGPPASFIHRGIVRWQAQTARSF